MQEANIIYLQKIVSKTAMGAVKSIKNSPCHHFLQPLNSKQVYIHSQLKYWKWKNKFHNFKKLQELANIDPDKNSFRINCNGMSKELYGWAFLIYIL